MRGSEHFSDGRQHFDAPQCIAHGPCDLRQKRGVRPEKVAGGQAWKSSNMTA